ncbi:DUF1763-domain-containing protein [Tothia fuscella]|uniref:DUF1763-domain-containing protein n=1 Tax=Tothia fuscella TaxID=1048955 RepID=A0A9P4NNW4_9PEZI|nr:DUF1763-domain-containing protein [Tothia fuscella]
MPPVHNEIITAYRALYRTGLRAIQFSSPARYVLRDRLRRAFRVAPVTDFEPQRITNTLEFLNGAAQSTGMEHHILRNLLMVWYWEPESWAQRRKLKEREGVVLQMQAYDHFYHTLKMLNESMGLCLR